MLSEQNNKKLKILFVMNGPWGSGLGIARVHFDLKKKLEALGHHVDYLSLDKIYPKGYTKWQQIKGPIYQEKFLEELKNIAWQYDVIDANYDCIPYAKESFGFKGLLIYRSHGLQPLYRIVEQSAAYKRMQYPYLQRNLPLKTKVGNLLRFLAHKNSDWILWDSLRYADVVHALNQAEYDYFKTYGIPEHRLALIPNGVSDELIDNAKKSCYKYSIKNEITFLGSWTLRKGIEDLPFILSDLPDSIQRINLLGTGVDVQSVHHHFPQELQSRLHIVPHFKAEELPTLLEHTKLGIFPSYVEGFGLAVVEQLALGIPVLAYNIPGPKDILESLGNECLVEMGNREVFKEKLNTLLELSQNEFSAYQEKALKRADDFRYSKVAKQFESLYYQKIKELR